VLKRRRPRELVEAPTDRLAIMPCRDPACSLVEKPQSIDYIN
jgi:hypothetical protein